MDFTFTEDQLLFQESVRDFLVNEVTAERIRARWDSESGRDQALWQQLAELGLTGMTVPEECGGLGLSSVDFILLAQECGYVALPEPLLENVLVAVPTLIDIADAGLNAQWLPKIAAGEARVAVGVDANPFVEDADAADLLLLQYGEELHAVPTTETSLTRNPSVDPSRRLFRVDWQPSSVSCVASGESAAGLIEMMVNRGALAAAAQALGLAQRMIDLAVAYTSERQQFGQPIGSFQAVKHHMADIAVRLDYARAPVYRAAWSVAHGLDTASRDVSHAKLVACEAADLAAQHTIQVHGAMGYTWEVDLHIFMKKAWALNSAWGDAGLHKQRVGDAIFGDARSIGAGGTFP